MGKTNRKIIAMALFGALIVIGIILTNLILTLNLAHNLAIGWGSTILYAIVALMVNRKKVFLSKEPEVREVIKEIVKEVPVYTQIPIENKTIEVVEKPVIKEIIRKVPYAVKVEKKVYIGRKRKKLNIPKFKFIGSVEAKRYHTRFCRLGKLIKKKYKIHNNSKNFFKKKHFKACKMCIKAKKRK